MSIRHKIQLISCTALSVQMCCSDVLAGHGEDPLPFSSASSSYRTSSQFVPQENWQPGKEPTLSHRFVGMLMKGDEQHSFWPHCTVTLIRPDIALTARHCVKDLHGLKLKVFFQSEGFREVSSSQILVFCDQMGVMCSKQIDDLAAIRFLIPFMISPVASMSGLSKLQPGAITTVVGFGSSSTYLFDNGIMRSGEVILGECSPCRSTDISSKKTAVVPPAICFDSTIRISKTESANRVGSQPGDSGGPMLIYDHGSHQLIGLARGTSWTCSDEAHSENRFVNLLDPRYHEWLSRISSKSDSSANTSTRTDILLAVESAKLDHENPNDFYELEIGPLATELIVTMNHSVGGWNPNPSDLNLLLDVEADCSRFVGAEVCSVKDPATGPINIRVQRVHRQATYQVTAIVEYDSPGMQMTVSSSAAGK